MIVVLINILVYTRHGCIFKGLGNGYAISACLGKEFLREASNEVF